ncbi:Molybdenum cofactor guanylyltransferase [Sinobacterium norvegicum]|uniref:Molybdenum cofactor guanylyltransferase n=1 Tax=Sinobacterium norvegicum TaxID=1641715 RepID=A0ABN8ED70_9GAMM|nr:molybdenum cofactor guanylyltransferase MobA [Sinobacterium norvegicum]CAH0990404.1 Molybdenum cofactor guanylyltransferase [Sinobacterium norvegicum]
MNTTPPKNAITAVILAGGQSLRFGQQDKAWAMIDQQPMVQLIIDKLKPQADSLIINCPAEALRYLPLGLPCIHDHRDGHQGPLAGIEAVLQQLSETLNKESIISFVPCDTPNIPNNLIQQLTEPLRHHQTDISFAADGKRNHYLCCAIKLRCYPVLKAYLDQGQRSMRGFIALLDSQSVTFNQTHYFDNINSPQDLAQLTVANQSLEPA